MKKYLLLIMVTIASSFSLKAQIVKSEKIILTNIVNEYMFTEQYIRGVRDAEKHFKSYEESAKITYYSSIVNPLIGLVPAITNSNTMIPESKLNFTNEDLMNNPDYYYGYTHQASRVNKAQIWKKWRQGSVISLAITGLVLGAVGLSF